MSVIIYGVRDYGRVDAHAGEHAETKFFHIWFAPLVPVGTSWVTPTERFAIKPSAKSIAAGYLRIWGPVAAIGLGSAGLQQLAGKSGDGLAMLLVAALCAVLAAWSWTWRSLRGEAARRRSDFNYVAFGSRCEPARRFAADRSGLKRALDRRWNERAPSRSPNEVAAHGASDASEAVLAYGLLRLSAIERGKAGASDGVDADRILAGEHTAPSMEDGPYRAGAGATAATAGTSDGLAALVSERAAAAAPSPMITAPDRAGEVRRAKRRSRLHLAGLVFLTMGAVGGIAAFTMSLRPTVDTTLKELRSASPPKTRVVRITCDVVDEPFWEEYRQRGSTRTTTAEIAMCQLGRYYLPVKFPAGAARGPVVTGKLYEIGSRQDWYRELTRVAPELEAMTLDLYVDATQDGADWVGGAIGLAMALGTPVLWVLWFRARKRRKATERALASAA